MKKTIVALVIISPLLLLVILGHGDRKMKHNELVKQLELSLDISVNTGVKAILQRDSLDKISGLSSNTAFLTRLTTTKSELSRQKKQLDGLRRIVLSDD